MTDNYRIIKLDMHSWCIEEEKVRFFLFEGSEKTLLIDSGFECRDVRSIIEKLTDRQIMLINTHADLDHVACNFQFSKAYMHPSEFAIYRSRQKDAKSIGVVWDGDKIDIGGRVFEVICMPGHTPGSIALLDRENRLLVAGDSIQDGKIYMFGVQRDIVAYLNSLMRIKTYAPLFKTIYASHSSITVTKEVLDGLINGTLQILAGNISPLREMCDGVPVDTYDVGCAKIMVDRDSQF